MTAPPPAAARHLREMLQIAPSPDPRHDYLVELAGTAGDAAIQVYYVPDRDIVSPASVAAYLAAQDAGQAAEALALAILDDFNNQLVPRWIKVTVTREQPLRHRVAVDDRQPGWKAMSEIDYIGNYTNLS